MCEVSNADVSFDEESHMKRLTVAVSSSGIQSDSLAILHRRRRLCCALLFSRHATGWKQGPAASYPRHHHVISSVPCISVLTFQGVFHRMLLERRSCVGKQRMRRDVARGSARDQVLQTKQSSAVCSGLICHLSRTLSCRRIVSPLVYMMAWEDSSW